MLTRPYARRGWSPGGGPPAADGKPRLPARSGDGDGISSLFGSGGSNSSGSGLFGSPAKGKGDAKPTSKPSGESDLFGNLLGLPPKASSSGSKPAAGAPHESDALSGLFGGAGSSGSATSKPSSGASTASSGSGTSSVNNVLRRATTSAEIFAPLGGALSDMVGKGKKQGGGAATDLAAENQTLRRELNEKQAQVCRRALRTRARDAQIWMGQRVTTGARGRVLAVTDSKRFQIDALQENLKLLDGSRDHDVLANKEVEIHRLNEAVDLLRAQLRAADTRKVRRPLSRLPVDDHRFLKVAMALRSRGCVLSTCAGARRASRRCAAAGPQRQQ